MTPAEPVVARSTVYGGAGLKILAISLVETGLATVMIGIRLLSTIKKAIPHVGWALYWVLIAWLAALISEIFLVVSAAFGIGNKTPVLMLYGTLFVALKCAWIAQISGLFAIGLGKVAAVAFLLSVQGPTFLKKRVFLIALAAINVAIDVACAFEIAFHCSPPEALWNATIGTCHNPNRNLALGYFPGSWNAASDLTLATYPIVLFWKLQMKRLHKVGFCLLFGLGAFAGVCSAIKTWQVHAILIAQDPAESINGLLIWTFTEMWIVLILTSVAPLWPLIRKIGSKLGSICSSERGHVQPHDDVELRNRQQSGVTSREAFTGGNDFVKLADTLNPEEGISMQRDVHVHREPVANSNCEDTSAFTNGRQAIQPASYV